MLEKSLHSLYRYIKQEKYGGWDIFDGLNSRIFKRSPFYRSRILRLAWIQFFKRSPVNFRKSALVPQGYNAKGLALFASGLVSSGKMEEAKMLLDLLKEMKCTGYAGNSWGYNFDWQARAFYVPVGTPNMVTTVFVANAFLDYLFAPRRNSLRIPQGKDYPGEINKEKSFHGAGANSKTNEYLDLAIGACEFILKELALFEDDEKLCFGYIPGEQARVHNANMLGAALLARVYSHTKHPDYYGNEGQSPLFLGLEGRGQRAGVRSKLVESLNR